MADKPLEWSTPRRVVVADHVVKRDRRGLPEIPPKHKSKKDKSRCPKTKKPHVWLLREGKEEFELWDADRFIYAWIGYICSDCKKLIKACYQYDDKLDTFEMYAII